MTIFPSFLDNFELTLKYPSLKYPSPFLMVVLGDFNAKSSNWYNKVSLVIKAGKLRQ